MKSFLPLLTVLWLVAVATGLGVLTSYQARAGVAATPSRDWPTVSRLHLASDRATLVMLAHPQCPCTRASVAELNTLLSRVPGKVSAYVLFMKPQKFASDWEKTALWRSAAAIPGVHVITDEDGREAQHFGAATSGQTELFDASGHLLFSGGITPGRGHEGENAGSDAIVSLLNTGKAAYHKTPVFGCALLPAHAQGGAN